MSLEVNWGVFVLFPVSAVFVCKDQFLVMMVVAFSPVNLVEERLAPLDGVRFVGSSTKPTLEVSSTQECSVHRPFQFTCNLVSVPVNTRGDTVQTKLVVCGHPL